MVVNYFLITNLFATVMRVFPPHCIALCRTTVAQRVERYPQFQNSQEFALDGGVIFDTLANSNESHADGVFILALECSI